MMEKKEQGSRVANIIMFILCMILIVIMSVVGSGFMAMKVMDMNLHRVDGVSMEPTVEDKSFVLTRGDKEIQRFDMILLEHQNDTLLKRVIGVPQDIITVIDGALFINGQAYDEPYLNMEYCQEFKQSTFQVVVPDNSYFVLGDNRDNSSDSRILGMMKKQSIEGVVVAHVKE